MAEKLRTKRAIGKDVDIAFVAMCIHIMHAWGLHERGSGIPTARCLELLKEGKAAGVFPSQLAISMVADELAGRPILPPRPRKRRARD